MARITAAYYHNVIRGIDTLSDSTKDRYIERLTRITTHIMPGRSLHYTLKHPDEFMKQISETIEPRQHHLILSYLSPILAIYRALPEYRMANNNQFLRWSKLFTTELARKDRIYNHPRLDLLATDFNAVEAMRDSLPTGSPARLLLAMTTYIPPLGGSDYCSVRVYTASQRPPTNRIDANYIWLRQQNPVLVVMRKKSQYKTRNTNENRPYFTIALPHPLVQIIREVPREYLFTSGTGRPMTEGSFNQWANNTLRELFGDRSMNTRQLRNLYVMEQFKRGRTEEEMDEIGRVMGQSFIIQDRLRPI